MSVLKRISPISKIVDRTLKKRSKISFNLEEPEFVLKNKFGSNQPKKKFNKDIESCAPNICPQCGNVNEKLGTCENCQNNNVLK